VIAETISANLLVKTIDAPGICTEDPKKHPNAKKIDEISAQRLLEMLSQKPLAAGAYEMIDPVAVKVIQRSKILTWIIPGENPKNLERILKGEHIGTRVVP
jgi:uridylate kinase